MDTSGLNNNPSFNNMKFQNEREILKAENIAKGINAKVKTKNKQVLDQSDFIRLLMKELQYQDPLEPMDNKNFIGQMAQFSNLQQSSEMTAHLEKISSIQNSNQSYSMLGKKVAYINPYEYVPEGEKPKTKVGTVEAISFNGSNEARLKIGNENISPYDVIQIYSGSDDNND
jgi:flagellar basal-body rod modification protein FlgD